MQNTTNRISVYDSVTNNIISKLESGIAPWIKPWKSGQAGGADRNIVSKKEYSGVNRLILGMSGYSALKMTIRRYSTQQHSLRRQQIT